jgi:hypothetical protein
MVRKTMIVLATAIAGFPDDAATGYEIRVRARVGRRLCRDDCRHGPGVAWSRGPAASSVMTMPGQRGCMCAHRCLVKAMAVRVVSERRLNGGKAKHQGENARQHNGGLGHTVRHINSLFVYVGRI